MRPVGHILPVGEQRARPLRPAFEDMAGKRAGGQLVIIVDGPAKFMHQRAERQRGIHHAASDHHVRSEGQSAGDRRCAQIGIGRDDGVARRKRRSREHFPVVGNGVEAAGQVIAIHHRDLHFDPGLRRDVAHAGRAAVRIDAAGVGDDPYAFILQGADMVLPDPFGEIHRIAERVALAPHRAQHRHGRFREIVEHHREIVEHHIVDTRREQLTGCDRRIPVKAAGPANPDRFGHPPSPLVPAAR